MSDFPKPRNIRRTWRQIDLTVAQAELLISAVRLKPTLAAIVEARGWRVSRGRDRGRWKRVDVRFEDGSEASVRFNARSTILRFGVECCA